MYTAGTETRQANGQEMQENEKIKDGSLRKKWEVHRDFLTIFSIYAFILSGAWYGGWLVISMLPALFFMGVVFGYAIGAGIEAFHIHKRWVLRRIVREKQK